MKAQENMPYQTLDLHCDSQGIATLTLDRPQKHNALSAKMIAELSHATQTLAKDEGVRCVVLSAKGESFCAGADLGWMKEQFTASRQQRIAEARTLAQLLHTLNTLPKPLIARIQGAAYGGGVGIVSVCDVAIASEGSQFAFTETRLGLIPAIIGPYVLAKMGLGCARRVFMSARLFNAQEACNLGLVAQVVHASKLDAAVLAEVKPYRATAPRAVSKAKAFAHALAPSISPETIEASIEQLADIWEQPEAHEGVTAFFERRKPHWHQET